jgi:lysophospholipase L1-like esterase
MFHFFSCLSHAVSFPFDFMLKGPNLLWHLKNGLLEPLNPKVWFILIGTNDIFASQCTDRFVVADILNVLRAVHEQRPEAEFIIHGILPRKDPGNRKSQFLGRYWKRIQVINAQIKRFCEFHPNLHFMQGGSVFMEETDLKGRRQMNVSRIDDGIHPTPEGLEAWAELIVKMVLTIMKNAKKIRSGP